MNKTEKEQAIKRYEERLAEFGYSPKTMGWRDKRQQWLRFKVLEGIGSLEGASILDVGCGFGDFYGYLRKRGIKVKYTGFDISAKIIERARRLYPRACFEVRDILTDPIKQRFDYAFCSGIFNWRIRNNMRFVKEMLKRMFSLSRKGIAVNMTTSYVDYQEGYLYYYNPKAVFDYCKSLSRFVSLRHDYPLYEFTVYLLRKGEAL